MLSKTTTTTQTFVRLLLLLLTLFISTYFTVIHCDNIITTIAGNGKQYFRGENISSFLAVANNPSYVCVTSTGEIIFSDTNNYRIRKIKTDGTVITIAGTGEEGSQLINGVATSIAIGATGGVAVNTADEIFFTDSSNHVIWKILKDGNMTRIAGITGVAGSSGDNAEALLAKLNNPRGIHVDPTNGDIYIADTGNHKIRRIDGTSLYMYTFAGTGEAGISLEYAVPSVTKFNSPTGVFVYTTGGGGGKQIYVADSGNNRIRKTMPDFSFVTIAGTTVTTEYFNGDGVATSTFLYSPTDVKVDSNGIVYFTDSSNHRIRKINSTGGIETIAGTGGQGFNGEGNVTEAFLNLPKGLFVVNNVIYFADSFNNRIRKLDLSTTPYQLTTILNRDSYDGLDASLINIKPNAIIEVKGVKYFSDENNHIVGTINSNTNKIKILAGTGQNGYNSDNMLATSASLNFPEGIFITEKGDLYIADTQNHVIRKVGIDNFITTIAGCPGSGAYSGDNEKATIAQLKKPTSVYVTDSDEVYIADYGNNRIRKVLTNGNIITIAGDGTYNSCSDGVIATNCPLRSPTSVFVYMNEVYFTETGNNKIRKVKTDNTIVTVVGSSSAGYLDGPALSAILKQPTGLYISSIGIIYFSEYMNNLIRRVSLNGIVTTIAGVTGTSQFNGDNIPATSATFYNPKGIFVSEDQSLYVADCK